MNTVLSDKEVITILLGTKTTEKIYKGKLLPIVIGELGEAPHPKLSAAFELSRRMLLEELNKEPCLTSTSKSINYLKARFMGQEYESFVTMFLDSQHRLLSIDELFRGTLDGSMVHPREIVKAALKYNAGACIFAHNHPSGVAEPSQADISITRRLKQSLELIGVRVLDHLVVGGSSVVSLAERGLF